MKPTRFEGVSALIYSRPSRVLTYWRLLSMQEACRALRLAPHTLPWSPGRPTEPGTEWADVVVNIARARFGDWLQRGWDHHPVQQRAIQSDDLHPWPTNHDWTSWLEHTSGFWGLWREDIELAVQEVERTQDFAEFYKDMQALELRAREQLKKRLVADVLGAVDYLAEVQQLSAADLADARQIALPWCGRIKEEQCAEKV